MSILIESNRNFTLLFHIIDIVEVLLLLQISIADTLFLFSSFSFHVGVSSDVFFSNLIWFSVDLTLVVVVRDRDILFFIIENGLLDLGRGWFRVVKFVFTGHFLNVVVFVVILVRDIRMLIDIDFNIWIESNTSIDKLVLSIFILFEVLLSNLFFSVDQAILNSVMVEPDFSVSVINLYQFLPVVELV